jgi:hypothetical protein
VTLADWTSDVYAAPYVWELERNGLVVMREMSQDGSARLPLPAQLPVPSTFRAVPLRPGMPSIEVRLESADDVLIYEHVVKQAVPLHDPTAMTRWDVLLIGHRRGEREDVKLVLMGGRIMQFGSKDVALRTVHDLFAASLPS